MVSESESADSSDFPSSSRLRYVSFKASFGHFTVNRLPQKEGSRRPSPGGNPWVHRGRQPRGP